MCAGGDHGEGGGKHGAATDPDQRLPGHQHGDARPGRGPRARGQHRHDLAERDQPRADDQQTLATVQVAQHPEGQLEDGDREENGTRDPMVISP